jgi:hypothetical protein
MSNGINMIIEKNFYSKSNTCLNIKSKFQNLNHCINNNLDINNPLTIREDKNTSIYKDGRIEFKYIKYYF